MLWLLVLQLGQLPRQSWLLLTQSKQVSGDRPRRGSSANRGGLCYDGFRCGLGLLLSLSLPTLLSPTGPVTSFPSPLEPRQSLISRDSSLEDLGLWAFGMGEDTTKLGKLLSLGVQWAGGKKGVQCWYQAPGLGGCGRREPYHVLPHPLEANMLAHATERSALGLPPLAATLAGAGGSPFEAIFGALSSLL